MARKSPTPKTVKRLFALSCNRCAFPDCKIKLVNSNGTVLADICHIEGAEDNGPRYNPNMDDDQRRQYENLILFCKNHHKTIDSEIDNYPISKLRIFKESQTTKCQEGTFSISTKVAGLAIQNYNKYYNQTTNIVESGTQNVFTQSNVTINEGDTKSEKDEQNNDENTKTNKLKKWGQITAIIIAVLTIFGMVLDLTDKINIFPENTDSPEELITLDITFYEKQNKAPVEFKTLATVYIDCEKIDSSKTTIDGYLTFEKLPKTFANATIKIKLESKEFEIQDDKEVFNINNPKIFIKVKRIKAGSTPPPPPKPNQAILKIDKKIIDLGTIKRSSNTTRTIRLENEGDLDLIIENIYSDDVDAIKIDQFASMIPRGSGINLTIHFDSKDKIGEYESTISIISNSASGEKKIFLKANIEEETITLKCNLQFSDLEIIFYDNLNRYYSAKSNEKGVINLKIPTSLLNTDLNITFQKDNVSETYRMTISKESCIFLPNSFKRLMNR